MSDIVNLEKRIDELESHLTHQENTIQDLSDITAKQWETIDTLMHKIDGMKNRILSLEEGNQSAPGPADPLPPHF